MHCHVKYIDVCEKSATFVVSVLAGTVCRRVHMKNGATLATVRYCK